MHDVDQELSELKHRLERLEAGCRESRHERPDIGRVGRISSPVREAGVHPDRPVLEWRGDLKPELRPLFLGLFGRHTWDLSYDIQPETKSWGCTPEPLIVMVVWDAGGSEEHFRLVDQVFSVIRLRDPNTGIVTATAIYSARLMAGAGASRDYAGGYSGPPYVPGYYAGPSLFFTLRSAAGAGLASSGERFSVRCHQNQQLNLSFDFQPALFDLVAGATWELNDWRVDRC